MKLEVILVPKDKSLLEFFSEMEERTKNSWIYIHNNVIRELKKAAMRDGIYQDGTDTGLRKYTETYMFIMLRDKERTEFIFECRGPWQIWHALYEIRSPSIQYDYPSEPEEIFFLKMAK